MMDPVQAYYATHTTPTDEVLDEEQSAQRYGIIVSGELPLVGRVRRRVGKILIHIGEKLAAEPAPVKWSNEAV